MRGVSPEGGGGSWRTSWSLQERSMHFHYDLGGGKLGGGGGGER